MNRKHGILFIGLFLAGLSTGFSQVIEGSYAIKNVQTGLLLRVKDAQKRDGTPIVLYTPTNWKCMTWDFKHVEGQTYQLQNLFTAKTLQPAAAGPTASLEQHPFLPGHARQEWEFTPVARDTYLIGLKGTQLYLTPSDPAGEVNSGIDLAGRQAGKLQHWLIYPQHPTM